MKFIVYSQSESDAVEHLAANGSGVPAPERKAFRRVALIYNPASGQDSPRRNAVIEEALAVLRAAGAEVEALATYAPGSAGLLAAEAARKGCDTVLACGGDGTVHEVLQALVETDVALGVVPLGTANALAADLGLGMGPRAGLGSGLGSGVGGGLTPAKAVQMLLGAHPTRVSVGRVHYCDLKGQMASRYFTVTAGIGADALLMSRMDARLKRRLGYILYLLEGLRVMATHSFPLFAAEIAEQEKEATRTIHVSQLLAVRIHDFGGVLHHLAPGASLRNGTLRLVGFKTRSRWHYLRFVLAVLFRRQTFDRQIELCDAVSVECSKLEKPIFVEADGELLGTLPARLEIVPHALTLLIPKEARP